MMNNFLVIGKIEEARHSADIILKSAGEITNRLSDIVWVVNPDRDSLLKLFDRLEEYAKDMASFHKIEVQTNIPETITALTLEMEVRRNIYLFCKEAINNAVKYSKATLLCLTIKEKEKLLEIIVQDNGMGFNVANVKRGNGLESMQKRANEINGQFNIYSNENEGTTISLICKITH